MIKLTLIGDIMLGRVIGERYRQQSYAVVCNKLQMMARRSDFVMANLESPVTYKATTDGDHLQFRGNPDILEELKWIDAFSLSNNHINDTGGDGIDETIQILEKKGFKHNGLFVGEYEPLIVSNGTEKIAVVTVTDMMNIPFDEKCHWDVLRVGQNRVFSIIKKLHKQNLCVLLYAHIGILFSRFPNPVTYRYLHECMDYGADIIVTAHSHCLGCFEKYNGKPIFHSLGDFVMDGNSYRRRRSAMLCLTVEGHKVTEWDIVPAETNDGYVTCLPDSISAQKMRKSFSWVSGKLAEHSENYDCFYKYQYKVELFNHIISTLLYLKGHRGIAGMLKMVIQRFEEVGRMFKWISIDRSQDRRDDDAIKADRKKFKDSDLF